MWLGLLVFNITLAIWFIITDSIIGVSKTMRPGRLRLTLHQVTGH
ncbi:MAG: hypothetical protein BWY95_02438 [Bacteroidetes bacterium ADurb.BinA104]|nr:MAG: hypothetical protein BWY95_02438 [Bacteroidetes bacterium ADurb.BinA104]